MVVNVLFWIFFSNLNLKRKLSKTSIRKFDKNHSISDQHHQAIFPNRGKKRKTDAAKGSGGKKKKVEETEEEKALRVRDLID